jgi:malate synthase
MAGTDIGTVSFAPVEGAGELLTEEFRAYLAAAHRRFTSKVHQLRRARTAVLSRTLNDGEKLAHPPVSEINTGDWKVSPVPEELTRPGIEISGPASITNMFINALNAGPDGGRAEGYLDDDEDSGGHRLVDTLAAARNRLGAVERTLVFEDKRRGRKYEIQPGEIPFFMHRERGLHLDEPDVQIDGEPVPAAILGTALTLFHAGRSQIERSQGVYFYLPKLESADEAAWYRDFFDFSVQHLDLPLDAVIRAIILVESLPAVYQMEEMLHALGPYGAGLNAARWDLKASILEYVMTDPESVWPDRFGVDIKTTDFIANIFRRLVSICLKRGAAPIGGMATALPDRNPEVNEAAAASIRADKEWEAHQGFIRAWVAHIFHMKPAADPFKKLIASGWKPTAEMADPDNYPVKLETPKGPITVEGTRRNIRTMIEYLEGWLTGRGAKGIDSLEGRPGVQPRLMEDLATARISVAQTSQRVLHSAVGTDTEEAHDLKLVKRLVGQELEDILGIRDAAVQDGDAASRRAYEQAAERYRKAGRIALRWVKNYTELDFRSLGSYTRDQLDEIAAAPDVF